MAFLNKINKCFRLTLKIENRICFSLKTKNLRLTEARLYSSLMKVSKNDLAKTRLFYSTETASTTVVKDQTTHVETNEIQKIPVETIISSKETSQKNPTNIAQKSAENMYTSVNDLSSALAETDNIVRRYGRLTTQEVENLLSKCKSGLLSSEAVMLIKCTGELLKTESVVKRRKWFERVLKKVSECCPNKTTEMLNAETAIRIENKMDFDPAVCLASYETLGLTPSKRTFHLILSQYCQQQEVHKALDILNHMKSNDWSVGAPTIHQILKAYIKIGKNEESKKLLAVMNQQGFRPTSETYLSLLQAHGSKGDVDAIKQVMREMADKGLSLMLRHAYDVVLSVVEAEAGDEKVEEVMDIIGLTDGTSRGERLLRENRLQNRVANQQRSIDFQDTTNIVLQLLAAEKYTAAVLILKSFSDQLYNLDKHESNVILKVFISQLIKDDVPLKDIYNFREQLVQANLLMKEWEPILFYFIKHQKIQNVLTLLEDLKNEPLELKEHYFWPLFHRAIKANKPKDTYKITQFMLGRFDHYSLSTTLYNWSMAPLLLKNKSDLNTILGEYKNIGMSADLRNMLELQHLVSFGHYDQARQLVQEGTDMRVRMLRRGLANGVMSVNYKADDFFKFMHTMKLKIEYANRICGQMLVTCIRNHPNVSSNNNTPNNNTPNNNNTSPNKLHDFINAWVDADVKIDPVYLNEVRSLLERKNVSKDTIERVASLGASSNNINVYDSTLTSELNADDLLINLSAAKKPQPQRSQSQRSQPQRLQPQVSQTSEPQESAQVTEARKMLKDKKMREFRTLVHVLSEKPDLDLLNEMVVKVNMSPSLINFFNRKLMSAHLNAGKQELMMDKLTPEDINSYISANVLTKIALKDAPMLVHIENLLRDNTQTIKGTSAYNSLYHYYIASGQVDKAHHVLQCKPEIRPLVRLAPLCHKARIDRNENLIRTLMEMHKEADNPRRVAVCHNNLILLKCELKDTRGAEQAYHDALNQSILFQHLSIRCLQALQSSMQAEQLPLPWKEGELERRIEEMSKNSSSDSSDSD